MVNEELPKTIESELCKPLQCSMFCLRFPRHTSATAPARVRQRPSETALRTRPSRLIAIDLRFRDAPWVRLENPDGRGLFVAFRSLASHVRETAISDASAARDTITHILLGT
jgi:hypothetical protein